MFSVFHANLSSLSEHAADYVLTLPKCIKALSLNEIHKHDALQVADMFRRHGFKAYYNIPEGDTNTAGHGGEIVATRSHILSNPIQPNILDYISEHFGSTIWLSACTIQFKGAVVISASIYLWCSEGLSERNNIILLKLNMLVNILKLPLICFGDFNLIPQEFLDGGWCEQLQVKIIYPNSSTTISTAQDRPIDFGLISTSIEHMYKHTYPIYTVPFGPHFALISDFLARPRSVQGLVQCTPKALPMGDLIKL